MVLLQVAENSAVFKRDLKKASEGADQRSGSREFHTKAVEKACDAKYEVTPCFIECRQRQFYYTQHL